jgi:CRP-like cAMP-binding protein
MTQTDPAIVEALRASKLAAELDADQTAALAAMMTLRDLAPNEVLVREGATDNHLYVIVAGTLAAMKHAGTVDQVMLASLHPGEFAGELAFIDGAERYASLVALGPTRVLGLERERFESLVDTNPRLLYRVMRSIVRAVHELQRRLSMQSIELTNYVYKQHGRY